LPALGGRRIIRKNKRTDLFIGPAVGEFGRAELDAGIIENERPGRFLPQELMPSRGRLPFHGCLGIGGCRCLGESNSSSYREEYGAKKAHLRSYSIRHKTIRLPLTSSMNLHGSR